MMSSEYAVRDDGFDPVHPHAPVDPYPEARGQRGSPVAALANGVGAVVSLGLVLGMAIWAVQLTVRDVSGVPVIEALEGPMREAPGDPGGTQAPHQGLAVNRIAEGAEAQPVPDRLVIAPPPVELREVTLASVRTEATPITTITTSDSAAAASPEVGTPDTAALIDRLLMEAQSDASPPAITAEAGAIVQPAVAGADDADAAIVPASVPGVVRSLRPTTRPGGLRAVQTVSRPLEGADTTVELAVAELEDGTRLVQLGAFDTAAIARSEWARLAGQFPDYFAERPRVIEEASSGGQAFFRLRAAGFDDLAGARRFCAVLVAQGAACIPVTVR